MHLCPWNGVVDASNFTLLAVFKTDASIQKPLALGSDDLPGHSSFASLGSAESIYAIVAKNFVLANGGITAYASDDRAVAVSYQVPSENGPLSFIRTSDGQPVSPAKVYCMLFNTDPEGARYPDELAVNGGDSDHFSLCQISTGNESVVIYNASETKSDAEYIWETCEDIYIYIRISPS
ncbi:hypothetical protein BJV74DRAFT_172645 [Russula compacta]|nr:hypothetical protein BJV74DRAFT_172645 [Russula compacta]